MNVVVCVCVQRGEIEDRYDKIVIVLLLDV